MESEFEILSLIENDPKKMLGNPSCEKLQCFMDGWGSATGTYIRPSDESFRPWLCSRYGLSYDYESPFVVARLMAGNDHDAFYLYFKELNSYRESHPQYFEPKQINQPLGVKIWDRREMIERTKAKPGLYIGLKTVTRLRGLLDGDAYARLKSDPAAKLYADLARLEEWLCKNDKFVRVIHCETLALYYSSGQEDQAFDWLIKKIEEFESLNNEA